MITRVKLNKNSICDNNFIKPKDKFRIVINNDYYAGILRCSLSSVSTSMEKFDIYNLEDVIQINVVDFVIKPSKIVLSSTDMDFPKIHFLKIQKEMLLCKNIRLLYFYQNRLIDYGLEDMMNWKKAWHN